MYTRQRRLTQMSYSWFVRTGSEIDAAYRHMLLCLIRGFAPVPPAAAQQLQLQAHCNFVHNVCTQGQIGQLPSTTSTSQTPHMCYFDPLPCYQWLHLNHPTDAVRCRVLNTDQPCSHNHPDTPSYSRIGGPTTPQLNGTSLCTNLSQTLWVLA